MMCDPIVSELCGNVNACVCSELFEFMIPANIL